MLVVSFDIFFIKTSSKVFQEVCEIESNIFLKEHFFSFVDLISEAKNVAL